MQADLGGAFYEMAIRDHVRMDVLTRKAAELSGSTPTAGVERMLELERADAAGNCPTAALPTATRCASAPSAALARTSGGGGVKAAIWPLSSSARRRRGDPDREKFGLLVASSVVATSAIVASAMTGTGVSAPWRRWSAGALPPTRPRSKCTGAEPVRTGVRTSARLGGRFPIGGAAPRSGADSGSRPATGRANRCRKKRPRRHPPRRPEAGLVKHVFVISLTSPGYDAPSAPPRRCPTLGDRCARRASCSPATRCSTMRRFQTVSPRSAARRPTPQTKRRLPDLRRVPAERHRQLEERQERRRLRLPGRNADASPTSSPSATSTGTPSWRG